MLDHQVKEEGKGRSSCEYKPGNLFSAATEDFWYTGVYGLD